MGWVAVAIAGAAVLQYVGGRQAGSSAASQASKARQSADAASQLQYDIANRQLELVQEQQDRWNGIYGPIEENLANFYGSLSESDIVSSGLQKQAEAFSQVKQQMETRAAQNGFGSAVQESMTTQLEFENAKAKAQIRADAPMQLAQAKAGFLSAGRGSDPSSAVYNSMNNMQNMYGQRASQFGNQAAQFTNQSNAYNQQAISGLAQGIGNAAQAYAYNQNYGYDGDINVQQGNNYGMYTNNGTKYRTR